MISALLAATLAAVAAPSHPCQAPLPHGPTVPAPIILHTSCGNFRLAPDGSVTRLPGHWLAHHSGGTGRRYGADLALRRSSAGKIILIRRGRVVWRSQGLYRRTGDSVAFGPHLFAFNDYNRGVFLTDLRGPERLVLRGRGLNPYDFTRHGELLVLANGRIIVLARDGTLLRRVPYRQRNGLAFDPRSETLYFVRPDGMLASTQGAHVRLIRTLRGVDGWLAFAPPGLLTFAAPRSIAITKLDGSLVARTHWPRSRVDNSDSGVSVSADGRSYAFRLSNARPGARRGEAALYVFHAGDFHAHAIYAHRLGPIGCAYGANMSWSGRFLLYSSADGQRDVFDSRSGHRIELSALARQLPHLVRGERAIIGWRSDYPY
jgi:hypothetical protein